jgi:hypothetical protein
VQIRASQFLPNEAVELFNPVRVLRYIYRVLRYDVNPGCLNDHFSGISRFILITACSVAICKNQ